MGETKLKLHMHKKLDLIQKDIIFVDQEADVKAH